MPWEEYYSARGQVRGIPKYDRIGLRYPVEIGSTGDVKATLRIWPSLDTWLKLNLAIRLLRRRASTRPLRFLYKCVAEWSSKLRLERHRSPKALLIATRYEDAGACSTFSRR